MLEMIIFVRLDRGESWLVHCSLRDGRREVKYVAEDGNFVIIFICFSELAKHFILRYQYELLINLEVNVDGLVIINIYSLL